MSNHQLATILWIGTSRQVRPSLQVPLYAVAPLTMPPLFEPRSFGPIVTSITPIYPPVSA
ncbi:hypothetical protein HGRIS_012823 [Hohenbuehelia grisea]|uniref:Uncharacterized protein n=1 Tax=Hohenbuehelia grisea TaxID=104357 RepID=A0ABR3ITL2_9AGAR